MSNGSEWVSLGEAAEIIGVHPATIRNWAERGELPCRRTPGGHRRFRRADLEQWLETHRAARPAEAQVVVQNALGRMRLETFNREKLAKLAWYARLDEQARAMMRQQGLTMMDALITHLAHPENDEGLRAAFEFGTAYGQFLRGQGLAFSQALQGYYYFVDILLDAVIQLAETSSGRAAANWGDTLRQVYAFTREVLMGMVEVYESPQSPEQEGEAPPQP